jgi:hypothetical protein
LLGPNPEGEGLSTVQQANIGQILFVSHLLLQTYMKDLFITSADFFSFEAQQQT